MREYRIRKEFALQRDGFVLSGHDYAELRVQQVVFPDKREKLFLFFSRKNGKYAIAQLLDESALEGADLNQLDNCFIELDETPEEIAQREAIEHLKSAADKLGYRLIKS